MSQQDNFPTTQCDWTRRNGGGNETQRTIRNVRSRPSATSPHSIRFRQLDETLGNPRFYVDSGRSFWQQT